MVPLINKRENFKMNNNILENFFFSFEQQLLS